MAAERNHAIRDRHPWDAGGDGRQFADGNGRSGSDFAADRYAEPRSGIAADFRSAKWDIFQHGDLYAGSARATREFVAKIFLGAGIEQLGHGVVEGHDDSRADAARVP